MSVKNHPVILLLLGVMVFPPAGSGKKEKSTAAFWRYPSDIASRNLLEGPGGKAHAPHGPFTFLKEDLDGSNPKFSVRDRDGVKWKIKLGPEAGPETVATRLVWAAGYFVNEDYFLTEISVQNMPVRVHRGQKLIGPGGSMRNVRLKREDLDKAGIWEWSHDPFEGTKEWNGLRTLMALINNWDLKDENNAIYQSGDELIYMVSDLGASFGTAGRSWPKGKSKGNLKTYSHSKLICGETKDTVDFCAPHRPNPAILLNLPEYVSRVHLEWIARNVPRQDARWMGELLSRLSPAQVRDAFRAAGYSPDEVEGFARVVERRIGQLTEL